MMFLIFISLTNLTACFIAITSAEANDQASNLLIPDAKVIFFVSTF